MTTFAITIASAIRHGKATTLYVDADTTHAAIERVRAAHPGRRIVSVRRTTITDNAYSNKA